MSDASPELLRAVIVEDQEAFGENLAAQVRVVLGLPPLDPAVEVIHHSEALDTMMWPLDRWRRVGVVLVDAHVGTDIQGVTGRNRLAGTELVDALRQGLYAGKGRPRLVTYSALIEDPLVHCHILHVHPFAQYSDESLTSFDILRSALVDDTPKGQARPPSPAEMKRAGHGRYDLMQRPLLVKTLRRWRHVWDFIAGDISRKQLRLLNRNQAERLNKLATDCLRMEIPAGMKEAPGANVERSLRSYFGWSRQPIAGGEWLWRWFEDNRGDPLVPRLARLSVEHGDIVHEVLNELEGGPSERKRPEILEQDVRLRMSLRGSAPR